MIAEIIQRLEDQIPDLAGRVSGVESLAAASEKVRALQAFVVFTGERAQPNRYGSQIHRQTTAYSFSVVLAFPGAGAHAKAALIQSEPLMEKVIAALMGWKHPAALAGTEYAGARPIGLSAGAHLLTAVEFTFEHVRTAG